MSKPNTLKDLLAGGHISLNDVTKLCREVFNGDEEMLIEGYYVALPRFDDLPDHVQQFVRKAFLEASIRNVLDEQDKHVNVLDVFDDGSEPTD